MKTKDSYFVKYKNGTSAWLAPGLQVPESAIEYEVRVMLFPEEGKVLRNKKTGEMSYGHWLKEPDTEADWEDVEDNQE